MWALASLFWQRPPFSPSLGTFHRNPNAIPSRLWTCDLGADGYLFSPFHRFLIPLDSIPSVPHHPTWAEPATQGVAGASEGPNWSRMEYR